MNRTPQTNKPHPVKKASRKVPEWLLFTRKVEREVKAGEEMAKMDRGSQTRPVTPLTAPVERGVSRIKRKGKNKAD